MATTEILKASEFMKDTNYIHSDNVLHGIYERACNKFFAVAGESVVFPDLADYIKSQIYWKKQSLFEHGLALLKEVCMRIAEDFDNGCENAAPDATCYRDVYFEVFNV